MGSASPPQSNVLLLLFQGFNTLDANGPFETLRKSGMSKVFKITTAAEDEITTSVEGVQMKRNLALHEVKVADYDIVCVPGGVTTEIQRISSDLDGKFMKILSTFASLGPNSSQPERIIFSVCSGALFLGALGVFDGGYCTTHYWYYETLAQECKKVAIKSGVKPGTVLPARYVDNGPNGSLRVISAGGISCGIDAALHIVKLRAGEKEALETAELLDYAWRKTEGVTFGETFDQAS